MKQTFSRLSAILIVLICVTGAQMHVKAEESAITEEQETEGISGEMTDNASVMEQDSEPIVEEEGNAPDSVMQEDAEFNAALADIDIDPHGPKTEGMFHYLDENGLDQSTDASLLEFVGDEGNLILEEGWYFVSHDWTFENRPCVTGEVKLILADGVTLNMVHGIRVAAGQTLSIYAQSEGEGKGTLICGSYTNQAGIGGNEDESCGTVNIYGGHIEAASIHQGAGIGGGDSGDGGEINIYGGDVHAEALNKSNLPTKGSGAGIGGGDNGNGGIVRIFGGTVYASSETVQYAYLFYHGAGIGGGDSGKGGTIEIHGGEIEAHGHHAVGAGKGADGTADIRLDDDMGIQGANYNERELYLSIAKDAVIEKTDHTLPPVSYLDADGKECTVADYTLLNKHPDLQNDIWNSGWYVVDRSVTFDCRPTMSGEVNIILCDGAVLNMVHGIRNYAGQTLSIYVQSNGGDMGKLIAGSYENQAGIGGNDDESNGIINIFGGRIEATGIHQGAGIGGGDSGDGGEINIYGGDVHAEARVKTELVTNGVGAGIGGGDNGSAGIIRIFGGRVYASSIENSLSVFSDNWGAGIGGGDSGSGGIIRICGGEIEAHGYHAFGTGRSAEGGTDIFLSDAIEIEGVEHSSVMMRSPACRISVFTRNKQDRRSAV